jgi:hypothetical protein
VSSAVCRLPSSVVVCRLSSSSSSSYPVVVCHLSSLSLALSLFLSAAAKQELSTKDVQIKDTTLKLAELLAKETKLTASLTAVQAELKKKEKIADSAQAVQQQLEVRMMVDSSQDRRNSSDNSACAVVCADMCACVDARVCLCLDGLSCVFLPAHDEHGMLHGQATDKSPRFVSLCRVCGCHGLCVCVSCVVCVCVWSVCGCGTYAFQTKIALLQQSLEQSEGAKKKLQNEYREAQKQNTDSVSSASVTQLTHSTHSLTR